MSDGFEGLYDAAGLDVHGLREPLWPGTDNWRQHLCARPVGALLGYAQAAPLDLALIWVLPAGPDPGRVPESDLSLIVGALDTGGAVALHATDQAAIEAVKAAVLPLVGGARA